MGTSSPGFRAMDTTVRLRRGFAARTTRIRMVVPIGAADLSAPARVVAAFIRAVDAGLFGPTGTPVATRSWRAEQDGGRSICTVEAAFPRMRPHAFAALARMVQASASEVTELSICELAPDATLVVRSFEADTEVTIVDAPWKIALPLAEPPGVLVELAGALSEDIAASLAVALHAWTEVVALGGFPGTGARELSSARLRDIKPVSDAAIAATFEHLICAHTGVEALFEALLSVHDRAPIARVAVALSGRARAASARRQLGGPAT